MKTVNWKLKSSSKMIKMSNNTLLLDEGAALVQVVQGVKV